MKFYRIEGGPVRLGPSMRVQFSNVQHRGREHMVDVQKKTSEGVIVVPKQAMDFKAGEVVGLADEPPKPMAEQFVEIKEGEALEAWKAAVEEDKKQALEANHSAEARRAAAAKHEQAAAKAPGAKPAPAVPVKLADKTEAEFTRKPADTKK